MSSEPPVFVTSVTVELSGRVVVAIRATRSADELDPDWAGAALVGEREARARLPDAQRANVVTRVELARRGPNTVTGRDAFARELTRVRSAGMAVNNEELAYGLRSIAVPVRSQGGEATAAINLAVHRSMVSMEDMVAHLGPPLERTAAQISSRIGHRPAVPR